MLRSKALFNFCAHALVSLESSDLISAANVEQWDYDSVASLGGIPLDSVVELCSIVPQSLHLQVCFSAIVSASLPSPMSSSALHSTLHDGRCVGFSLLIQLDSRDVNFPNTSEFPLASTALMVASAMFKYIPSVFHLDLIGLHSIATAL